MQGGPELGNITETGIRLARTRIFSRGFFRCRPREETSWQDIQTWKCQPNSGSPFNARNKESTEKSRGNVVLLEDVALAVGEHLLEWWGCGLGNSLEFLNFLGVQGVVVVFAGGGGSGRRFGSGGRRVLQVADAAHRHLLGWRRRGRWS